jgi:hypothetical protein
METIFDHNPTPEELRYLYDLSADTYRAAVSEDRAFEDLCMLFAMRQDDARSLAYARRISDKAYVRLNLTNYDLIPPSLAKNRDMSADIKSKAA